MMNKFSKSNAFCFTKNRWFRKSFTKTDNSGNLWCQLFWMNVAAFDLKTPRTGKNITPRFLRLVFLPKGPFSGTGKMFGSFWAAVVMRALMNFIPGPTRSQAPKIFQFPIALNSKEVSNEVSTRANSPGFSKLSNCNFWNSRKLLD